jgi:stage II sporulation protein M
MKNSEPPGKTTRRTSYWKWAVVSALLLAIGIAAGTFPAEFELPLEYIAGLEELSNILVPSSIFMFFFILLKNVTALLISFAFSPFFCITPLLTLLVNGWVIGYVGTKVMEKASAGYLIAGLLPHGIFEIPALIMAQAASLSFGTHIILYFIKRRTAQQIVDSLKYNVKYLAIALVLLVPAAIIETYVTPLLLK